MIEHIAELAVREFAERVKGTAPSPGGGAVGAVLVALAAACAHKAVAVSAKRCPADADLPEALVRLSLAITEALKGADEDAATFDALMHALRLPKGSGDTAQARRETIAQCASEAVNVGENLRNLGQQVRDTIALVRTKITKNIIGDVHAALAILDANEKIQTENIEANKEVLKH